MNTYGDISPRTAAYAATTMLERALPTMCMAKFGQQQPIPRNKSTSIKFRRYNAFAPNTTPLVEGVTPTPDTITPTDVTATLQQFGRHTIITDVIEDTHEDPVLQEYAEVMGELAGQTMELVIFNAIRAGTSVLFNNGTQRTDVNTAITTTTLNRAIRTLKRQNAKYIGKMLSGTDKVGTVPIRPGFVAFCHPDLQNDLEILAGFKVPAEYGTYSVLSENEMGSYKEIRFLASTLYAPWLSGGGSSASMLANGVTPGGSVPCDVYPIIIAAKDAYATVSLAGATAVTPMVHNPKVSDSDPLAQRGRVGFKMYATATILNDAWMVRVETAVTA
jgi:N4-gp56 family major capsid protein